jgi:chemotaxis protein histidine kinase CheA
MMEIQQQKEEVRRRSTGRLVEPMELFRRQALAQLDETEEALHRLQDTPDDRDVLDRLCESAEMICDLAMVYGYEDVEALAYEIHTNARKVLASRRAVTSRWCDNILEAVHVLRGMVEKLPEDQEESLADRQATLAFSADEDGFFFDRAESEDSEASSQEDVNDLFDIVEDETLTRLMEEATDSASTSDSSTESAESDDEAPQPASADDREREETSEPRPEGSASEKDPAEDEASDELQASEDARPEQEEAEDAVTDRSHEVATDSEVSQPGDVEEDAEEEEESTGIDLFEQVFAEELEAQLKALRLLHEQLVDDAGAETVWQDLYDTVRRLRDNAFKLDLREIHSFSAEFVKVVDRVRKEEALQTPAAVEAVRLGVEFFQSYLGHDRDLNHKREYVLEEFTSFLNKKKDDHARSRRTRPGQPAAEARVVGNGHGFVGLLRRLLTKHVF